MNEKNLTQNELLNFLREIDEDFPIPLSLKTDLAVLAKKLFDKADTFFLKRNGEIVGIVSGYITNSTSEVSFLSIVATKKQYRGQGVAKQLLNQYIEKAKDFAKIKSIELYTRNPLALKLYLKLGFVEIDNQNRPGDVHLIYNIMEH